MTITKENAIALLCCAKMAAQDLQERETELHAGSVDYDVPGTMDHVREAAVKWQSEQIERLYLELGQFEDAHPIDMANCYAQASASEKQLLGITD